ncbi:hypothetical protein DLH72_00600 [Candidatus Gracilibacteria bacterium]|nr:MAG: hypothetical protein DLH72_00600 [Candidatus Gracilibacteria bacterium]
MDIKKVYINIIGTLLMFFIIPGILITWDDVKFQNATASCKKQIYFRKCMKEKGYNGKYIFEKNPYL